MDACVNEQGVLGMSAVCDPLVLDDHASIALFLTSPRNAHSIQEHSGHEDPMTLSQISDSPIESVKRQSIPYANHRLANRGFAISPCINPTSAACTNGELDVSYVTVTSLITVMPSSAA